MKDLLDALSDVLNSDLVKENTWQVAVLVIAIIILTALVTSVVFNRLIIPLRLKKSENVLPDYKMALEENKKLKKEISLLKCTEAMLNAASQDDTETIKPEEWEKQFLAKK